MRSPRFSIVLRLTMSHVMISCVGVKHIPGASGESKGSQRSPRLKTRTSGQSRLASISPGACSTCPRNNALRRDAKSQELARAGMIVQARCDSGTARADNLCACDWAPPCSTGHWRRGARLLRRWCYPCACVPLRLCVPLTLSLRLAGPPGECASSKSAIFSAFLSFRFYRVGSCPASNSASKAAPPSWDRITEEVLEDLPRLLDCVDQVFWWLTCVWVPQVFDDPRQSFQGFHQAHVDLCDWHHWQRGFLHEHLQVCLGLHHLLLRLLEILLGLLQRLHRLLVQIRQNDEILPALGPSSVPRAELASSPPPPSALRFPRCGYMLRASPMPLACASRCLASARAWGRSLRIVARVSCLSRGIPTLLWPSHGL